jgi:hypothetical protein
MAEPASTRPQIKLNLSIAIKVTLEGRVDLCSIAVPEQVIVT